MHTKLLKVHQKQVMQGFDLNVHLLKLSTLKIWIKQKLNEQNLNEKLTKHSFRVFYFNIMSRVWIVQRNSSFISWGKFSTSVTFKRTSFKWLHCIKPSFRGTINEAAINPTCNQIKLSYEKEKNFHIFRSFFKLDLRL